MSAVVSLPSSLSDQSFEQVLAEVAGHGADDQLVIDARGIQFVSPFALTALLALASSRRVKSQFLPPTKQDQLQFLTRVGFFRETADLFDTRGFVPLARSDRESDLMLELTRVTKSDHLSTVVDFVQQKAEKMLVHQLHFEPRATRAFVLTLGETCHMMAERTRKGAWVTMQVHRYRKRLGRQVALLAIGDAGATILQTRPGRSQMGAAHSGTDATALEELLFSDHAFKGVRGFVSRRDGKLVVRSGTARMAFAPRWDDDTPLRDNLAPLSGIQIEIVLPERADFTALVPPTEVSLLIKAVVVRGPRTDEGHIIEAVTVPWYEIAALLSRDPRLAFQLSPEKWEEIVAGTYLAAGFDEVILTPRSGDLGRDVIAVKKGVGTVRVIDQVKAYRPGHLVTAGEVRSLMGVLQCDGASKGFLTTTSDFAPRILTDPLITPLIPSRLELVNGAALFSRLAELSDSSRKRNPGR